MKDSASLRNDDGQSETDNYVAMSHVRNNNDDNNNNNNSNNKPKICLLIVVEIPVDRDIT